MTSENENSLLLLWTPLEKSPDKNPLTFEQRFQILRKIFPENILKIVEKKDNPKSDLAWVFDIYIKVLEKFPKAEEIDFYYWAEDDSAYSALKENLQEFCPFKINFIKNDRQETFVEHNWEKLELSATNFRKYLRDWDFETAKKFVDEEVFEEIKAHF